MAQDNNRILPTNATGESLLAFAYARVDKGGMTKPPNKIDPVSRRILDLVADRGTNLKAVSLAIGKNHAYLQQFMMRPGSKHMKEDVRESLAAHFGVSPDEFRPGPAKGHSVARIITPGGVRIAEIDALAGAGLGGEASTVVRRLSGGITVSADAEKAPWILPGDYARGELGVDPRFAVLIEVRGDSMHPTLSSGDRVMIDTRDRTPSPPGLFALWDGLGLTIKRLEVARHGDPITFRLISDNQMHGPQERSSDEINIIGRLKWRATRL